MIRITTEYLGGRAYRLTLEGHAGAARTADGHDLVCAAASMLFYTLAESARKDAEIRMQDRPGDAQLVMQARRFHRRRLERRIGMILDGFGLLARDYPGSVELSPRQDPA